MESINKYLSTGEQDGTKIAGAENQIQGLYFDLLSCLGGGDHPSLPQGYKLKPMSGFLDIVEAFNDVAKLHAAGSGIICEVGSKESVEDGILSSGSGETLEATKSDESGNTVSLESFPCSADSQRQSSADSNQSVDANTTNTNESKVEGDSSTLKYSLETQQEKPEEEGIQKETDKQYILDENANFKAVVYNNEPDIIKVDKKESIEDLKDKIEAITIKNDEKDNEESHIKSDAVVYACTNNIEEVGPPLVAFSDSILLDPAHREITQMEKEMQKYSDELREIERMLKEHLKPSVDSHQPTLIKAPINVSESLSSELHPNCIVQTLADGLMSPSCALEMMYDMESNRSPCNPQSSHTSTYQSCTSFTSWQNQPRSGNSLFNSSLESVRRTPSIYMECTNLNETDGIADYTQFSKAFNSSSQSFFSEPAEFPSTEFTGQNGYNTGELKDWEGSNILEEMVNSFEDELDMNANDVSYCSVNEESDVQEFTDAEEDLTKSKREKKIRFKDKSAASSDDEHLWTSASASGSEYEDVGDGTTT